MTTVRSRNLGVGDAFVIDDKPRDSSGSVASVSGLLEVLRRLAILPSLFLFFVTMMGVRGVMPGGLYLVCVAGLMVAVTRLKGSDYRVFLLYILGFMLFNGLRVFGDETGQGVSVTYPIDVDRSVFGAVPSIWLQDKFYTPGTLGALDSAAIVVYLSYFKAHFVVGGLIWFFKREYLQTYVIAILATLYLGLVGYYLLPTAPPWLAAQEGYLPEVVRVFHIETSPVWSQASESGTYIAGTNDVGAMPSLHTALTMVIALIGWRIHRVLGVLGLGYVAAMGFSLVYLGEHYVIDVVAGVGTACLATYLMPRVLQRFTNRTVIAKPELVLEPVVQRNAA